MSEETLTKQRDILFEACKKVATSNKCPPWIGELLKNAVMEAKKVKEEFPSFDEPNNTIINTPIQVNDIVIINANNTSCKAQVIEESDMVNGVRLFVVRVIEANKNHALNSIFNNVPETFMTKIRG